MLELDPLVGTIALDGHSCFERLYRDIKAGAVDVPEDFAWRAVDLEDAVLDFGGLIGCCGGGCRGGSSRIVNGSELDGEIGGKVGGVGREVDRCVSGCGRDGGCSAIVDAGFGAF